MLLLLLAPLLLLLLLHQRLPHSPGRFIFARSGVGDRAQPGKHHHTRYPHGAAYQGTDWSRRGGGLPGHPRLEVHHVNLSRKRGDCSVPYSP